MSFYAYEDEERHNEIFAENATADNKLDEYYCPTHGCTARLCIRGINGDRSAHFAAKPSNPHSQFCRISVYTYDSTLYDEEQFSFITFMNNLLEPEANQHNNSERGYGNGDGNIRPVSTVRQLYIECIQRSIYQRYNGMRIADLLIDRRTRHIYFRYIMGMHLIECYCYRYDQANRSYYAKYFLDDGCNEWITIQLRFNDDVLYRKQYDRIFRRNIVVAGNWRWTEERCITEIVRNKQIYPLNY